MEDKQKKIMAQTLAVTHLPAERPKLLRLGRVPRGGGPNRPVCRGRRPRVGRHGAAAVWRSDAGWHARRDGGVARAAGRPASGGAGGANDASRRGSGAPGPVHAARAPPRWRRSLRLWLTAGGPLIRVAARRRCGWNPSPVVPWGGATFLGDEAQRGGAGVDDTGAAAAAHKARPRPPSPPPRHRRVRARPLAWRNSVAAGVAVDGAKTVSWPLPAPFGGSCQGRTLPPLQLRPLSPWLPAPPPPWRCTRRRHRRRHRRPRHHQLH